MEPTGTLYPRFDLSTRDKSKFDGGELTVVLGEGLGGGRARGRRGHEAFGSHRPGRGSEPGDPRPRASPPTGQQPPFHHLPPPISGASRHERECEKQEVGEGDERERGVEFRWGPECQACAGVNGVV